MNVIIIVIIIIFTTFFIVVMQSPFGMISVITDIIIQSFLALFRLPRSAAPSLGLRCLNSLLLSLEVVWHVVEGDLVEALEDTGMSHEPGNNEIQNLRYKNEIISKEK